MKRTRLGFSLFLIICLSLQSLTLQALPCVHSSNIDNTVAMTHCEQMAQQNDETQNDVCAHCAVCHLPATSPLANAQLLSHIKPHPEQNAAIAAHFYHYSHVPLLRPPQVS